jgi:ribosomal-protein-alanine N-acetyltransferase
MRSSRSTASLCCRDAGAVVSDDSRVGDTPPAAVSLRPMRWWDIELLVPLERELFAPDPWSAEGFWSELAGVPDTRYYVVAEDAGTIVGYAGLMVSGGEGDVQTVAVRPSAQGRGVGARLLTELLDEAARRDCHAVLLEVRVDNQPAQRLYERFGFERIGVRRGYYQPGNTDAVVMRRRLSRGDLGVRTDGP